MKFAAAIVVMLSAAPAALAWGTEAHSVVGAIAQQLLTPEGTKFVSKLLPGTTLDEITSWADSVKYSGKYAATRVLHYADANDNPPATCNYDDARDCADGKCLVGAVATYTDNAGCTKKMSAADRADALKFLAHFLGDITQPLHVKRMREDYGGSVQTYAKYLVDQIKSGKYKTASKSWVSKHTIKKRNSNGNSLAAVDWATDSDKLDCTAVWPAYDADPNQDFSGSYYTDSVPIIDIQIAKGGLRLADWISQIAASCANKPSRVRR
ncbi:hypothetical protein BSLG_002603 [Batrachochytrium salamandrivorans]|nr:hypothetical protein BSLG_002603 [Batrachochytrium salamandrivorans]